MSKNDPPTTMRMGFGYEQARSAGLGGVRPSRSPRQVNRSIKDAQVARELRKEVDKDPDWAPFVKHWIEEGRSSERTLHGLRCAQRYVWAKRKGYSLQFRLRYTP